MSTTHPIALPAGYVMRHQHRVIAKPVRETTKHDAEMLRLAGTDFGFLLTRNHLTSLATFAAQIELHCRHPKARQVASSLHHLSA